MIHSGQFIDIGINENSDVLASIAEHCQKVSLKIYDIKNLNKIYDTYFISPNEEIIAYCKGGIFGLTISGIVFTDKAFYSQVNANTQIKILYTDLCNYIITRQFDESSGSYLSNHGGVFLRNQNGEQEIFGGTLIARNIAAEEIFKILKAIQNELYNKNEFARNKMENMISDIFKSYREKMKCGNIKTSDNIMIRALQTIPRYSENAIFLLAENRYRLFNEELYTNYINSLSVDNLTILVKLQKPNEIFAEDYINDLSNLKNEISVEYLNKVCSNIEKKNLEALSKDETIIYALVLTRLYKFSYAKRIILKANKIFGSGKMRQAENFLLIYGNRLMKSVYDSIVGGKEIDSRLFYINDGLGLTPLHYQLILKSDCVDEIIHSKNWSKDFSYLKSYEPLKQIYDYALLATIKHCPQLDIVVENTDSRIKKLKDDLAKLQEQADCAAAAIKSIDNCLLEARRQLGNLKSSGNFEAISDIKDSMEDLENSRRQSDNILAECMRRIPEVKEDIYARTEEKKHTVLKNLQNLTDKNSSFSSPFIELLLQIYENSNDEYNLKNIVCDNNQYSFKVYNYKNFRFLLPDTFILNLPYYKIKIEDDGTICNAITVNVKAKKSSYSTPLYGNSWYSTGAHIDTKILTSEYRKLVKQYHPDICREEFANKLFVEITEEYKTILANLK